MWFLLIRCELHNSLMGVQQGFSPGFSIVGCTPNSCLKGGLWSTWAEQRYKARRQQHWVGAGGVSPPAGRVWGASHKRIFTPEMLWQPITTYFNFKYEFIIWSELLVLVEVWSRIHEISKQSQQENHNHVYSYTTLHSQPTRICSQVCEIKTSQVVHHQLLPGENCWQT